MNKQENTQLNFHYRQLQNNLRRISEVILQSLKDGNCNLKVLTEEPLSDDDPSSAHEIRADLEKSLVIIYVAFNFPTDYYGVDVWDKTISASDSDRQYWEKSLHREKDILCPGQLKYSWSESEPDGNDQSTYGETFNKEMHTLVYTYISQIIDEYCNLGSLSPSIKDLF
jgi:hypothetical protein